MAKNAKRKSNPKTRNFVISIEPLDGVLLALTQAYESDPQRFVSVEPELLRHPASIQRCLRSLCGLGWLSECDGSGYGLTDLGYRGLKIRIRKLRDARQRKLRKELFRTLHRQDEGLSR